MIRSASAQVMIKGTVYDISQKIPLSSVSVVSTSGPQVVTDSIGEYRIIVPENDSLYFSYLGKRSPWFSVKAINNPWNFDIALRVYAPDLPEIFITKQSYHEDSLQNRREYEKIFDYRSPHIATSTSSGDPGATVGVDLDALVNMFRFDYNKRQKGYQKFFEWEEQEKYIDHRFNKPMIKRLTNLPDDQIADFVKQYRPTYEFVESISEVDLGTYIQKCKEDYDSGHKSTATTMMNTYKTK